MKKNEISVKCKLEADAIANLLSDMAKSFREGKVVIQKKSSFITLNPAGQIEVEIEAVEKKGKQKIEIELSWKEEKFSDKDADEIRVTCDEPCLDESMPAVDQSERNPILYRQW
ncbi:MAG: amphi-Trp domain-containing protein [Desulfatirhabdiaceae bacterium]